MATMSKRVYVETAAAIKAQVECAAHLPESGEAVLTSVRTIAGDLAYMFKRNDSRFNLLRFMDACGFGDPNGN